jgi:methyltransferase-like protein
MHPPQFALDASERPRTTPLALRQAANREPISNLNHCSVELTEFERYVLSLLDGTRTRGDLRAILAEQVRQGVLVLEKEGQPFHAPERTQSVIEQTVERSLQKFAGLFLLCE